MYHLRLTLETPAANLALDEALLEAAETGDLDAEVLRLWESPQHAIVLGRSSPPREVHAEVCRAAGVPILRRISGGGAVTIGPGCLMYALLLDMRQRPELRGIDRMHISVLNRMAAALSPSVPSVACAGTSDLTMLSAASEPPRKFSGNSLRVRRNHLLYHGTLLYDFEVSSLGRWLGPPTREPAYRRGRSHEDFVNNLPIAAETLVAALISAWQAHEPLGRAAQRRLTELAASRRVEPPN